MKKRFFIVPNDPDLRQALNDALIVVHTVHTTNGQEVDVCDIAYARKLKEKGLMKYVKETELDVITREELQEKSVKKKCFVVPNDPGLRQAFNDALIVIYTIKLPNGQEVDVCDDVYAQKLEETKLRKYVEAAEIDVKAEEML